MKDFLFIIYVAYYFLFFIFYYLRFFVLGAVSIVSSTG